MKTNCAICQKIINRKPCEFIRSKRHFCSRECDGKYRAKNIIGDRHPNWKAKIIKNCETCQKIIHLEPNQSDRKFCSAKCYGVYLSKNNTGKSHPLWKGGVSSETCRRCTSKTWKELRLKIMKRDNNSCRECGANDDLTVHHRIPYRISKSHKPKNLITLCRSCHMRIEWQYLKLQTHDAS